MNSARILAVDDETSTTQALAEMLGLWGHKVETAGDGTDALKKAAEFRPDVVLSDLAMPETDGLWLLRALNRRLLSPRRRSRRPTRARSVLSSSRPWASP